MATLLRFFTGMKVNKDRYCRYCGKKLPKGSWFFCRDREYPKPSSCTRKFEIEYGEAMDDLEHDLVLMKLYKAV